MAKISEEEKMRQMHAWLGEVCERLGVDRAILDKMTPEMLDLIRIVAHGPSRPGAPMTAFLVGLAAAGGTRAGSIDALAGAVHDNIVTVTELVERTEAR